MSLPELGPAFRWSRETWGYGLRCRRLETIAQHVFTTKQLQLRPFEQQIAGWTSAVQSVGGDVGALRRIRQVHGNIVRVVEDHRDEGDAGTPPDADAIVSGTPGDVLAVQVADCVPMIFADGRGGVVAAVHAGWRGSCAGIAQRTVDTMRTAFGTRVEDLIVALGPSIGACCYEVGEELVAAFRASGVTERQLARWFSRTDDGALRLDLWMVNQEQLVECGVAADRIHLSRLCTLTHAEVFDSYRAEGPNAGRMAALVRVPPDGPRRNRRQVAGGA